MTFISSPETVSISPSDVITTTMRFQSNRLPAHIPRVGHSRVGEQEERTLGTLAPRLLTMLVVSQVRDKLNEI